MSHWDDDFRQLQIEFLRSGLRRLIEIDGAVERLAAGDRDALTDLKRYTHRLVGTGATYGQSAISDLARRGEQRCDALLATDRAPAAGDLDAWRTMRDALAQAFEDATPGELSSGSLGPLEHVRRPAAQARVLVVDQDPTYRDRLADALQREALDVVLASTVTDAMAEIDLRLPNGLIVDLHLPDGTGYAVMEHLRKQPGGEEPAGLMLGHVGDLLDQVEAIHAGADACYTKPGEVDAAIRKLVQLLERPRAEAPRVLMVEDDEFHAAFARGVLESAGYNVDVCEHPRALSDRLTVFQPELILMDVNLPEISGYDLARLVRQQEQHAALPIIFLTSEAEMASRIAAAQAGGDEHLTKPVHPALLASAVGARLERARFIRTLLYRDGLTRLLTHASFMEQVQQTVDKHRRGRLVRAALVMLDVDHFKRVNDTHGHQAGDRVLVALASLLRQHLRRSDVIGRYGGEEFGVLLEDLDGDGAERLMSRLLEEFAVLEHVAPSGERFRCTFSAGVCGLDDGLDRRAWIDAADQALYEAKRAGRRRVAVAWRHRTVSRPGPA
jgi:diguanylate cyclase (GGDEF)-like protein